MRKRAASWLTVSCGTNNDQIAKIAVKKSFSCLYMKNINLKIPHISPDSNVEIVEFDDNIRKFYLQIYYRKMEYHECWLLCIL